MAAPQLAKCPKCDAVCTEPKDVGRFKRRHPSKCVSKAERGKFAKELAKGTRSVDFDEPVEFRAWLEH